MYQLSGGSLDVSSSKVHWSIVYRLMEQFLFQQIMNGQNIENPVLQLLVSTTSILED